MLLVTAEQVRNRLGLGSDFAAQIDPVLESYITSAQFRVEATLGTRFFTDPSTDLFLIDSSMVGGVTPNGFHRLMLNYGFVQTFPAPTVFPTDKTGVVDDLAEAIPFSIDYEKGILLIDTASVGEGDYVSVSYESGFDEQNPAPDWLQECLIAAVAPLYNASEPTNNSPNAGRFYDTITKHIDAIVADHNRGAGIALKPIK